MAGADAATPQRGGKLRVLGCERLFELLEHALLFFGERHRRLAFISAAVFVLGIVLLITGVIMPQTVVSVAGFVLMLGGAYFGLTEWRRSTQPEQLYAVGSDKAKGKGKSKKAPRKGAAKPRSCPAAPSGSFMERMEERWRRRRDSGY